MNSIDITDAHLLRNHVLLLRFSDGREGALDFNELLATELPPVFQALRDPAVFRDFQLCNDMVHWRGNLDLAPEYLYFQTFRHEPSLRERFTQWGYLQPEHAHA